MSLFSWLSCTWKSNIDTLNSNVKCHMGCFALLITGKGMCYLSWQTVFLLQSLWLVLDPWEQAACGTAWPLQIRQIKNIIFHPVNAGPMVNDYLEHKSHSWFAVIWKWSEPMSSKIWQWHFWQMLCKITDAFPEEASQDERIRFGWGKWNLSIFHIKFILLIIQPCTLILSKQWVDIGVLRVIIHYTSLWGWKSIALSYSSTVVNSISIALSRSAL